MFWLTSMDIHSSQNQQQQSTGCFLFFLFLRRKKNRYCVATTWEFKSQIEALKLSTII